MHLYLELQVVVSHHLCLGDESRSSARTTSAVTMETPLQPTSNILTAVRSDTVREAEPGSLTETLALFKRKGLGVLSTLPRTYIPAHCYNYPFIMLLSPPQPLSCIFCTLHVALTPMIFFP